MAESESVRRSTPGYHGRCASKLRSGSRDDSTRSVSIQDIPDRGSEVDSAARGSVQSSKPPECRASHSGPNSGTFGRIQQDISGISSSLYGGDQRILQFALKYVF